MKGVIISTGQWPRSGWRRTVGKPFADTPQGRRTWAGVPGVQYPDTPAPLPAEATAPARKGKPAGVPQATADAKLDPRYMTTAEAAGRLGITCSAARASLLKAKARCVLCGGRYLWERAHVEKIAKAKGDGVVMDAPPRGWLTMAEACERLGVARSTLQRYMERGVLRVRKVHLGTRYHCLACITPEHDIEKLREAREACLLAEEYRRKYEAALAALKASNQTKTR